jgi:hypothetical protein
MVLIIPNIEVLSMLVTVFSSPHISSNTEGEEDLFPKNVIQKRVGAI